MQVHSKSLVQTVQTDIGLHHSCHLDAFSPARGNFILNEPAQWLSGRASALCAGSIPGRVIPTTLKMVLAALSLGAQH